MTAGSLQWQDNTSLKTCCRGKITVGRCGFRRQHLALVSIISPLSNQWCWIHCVHTLFLDGLHWLCEWVELQPSWWTSNPGPPAPKQRVSVSCCVNEVTFAWLDRFYKVACCDWRREEKWQRRGSRVEWRKTQKRTREDKQRTNDHRHSSTLCKAWGGALSYTLSVLSFPILPSIPALSPSPPLPGYWIAMQHIK